MGGDDLSQILAVLILTFRVCAHRGGGSVRVERGGGGTLDTGIHIRLVVIADVNHVVVSFHGAGEGLKTDVVCTAVASEGDELVGVFDFAFFA